MKYEIDVSQSLYPYRDPNTTLYFDRTFNISAPTFEEAIRQAREKFLDQGLHEDGEWGEVVIEEARIDWDRLSPEEAHQLYRFAVRGDPEEELIPTEHDPHEVVKRLLDGGYELPEDVIQQVRDGDKPASPAARKAMLVLRTQPNGPFVVPEQGSRAPETPTR